MEAFARNQRVIDVQFEGMVVTDGRGAKGVRRAYRRIRKGSVKSRVVSEFLSYENGEQ